MIRSGRHRRGSWFRDWTNWTNSTAFFRARFTVFAALSDASAIIFSAIVVGIPQHFHLDDTGALGIGSLQVSIFVAVLFVAFNLFREDYGIADYVNFGGHGRRVFLVWNTAVSVALLFKFAIEDTTHFSPGAIALFYIVGFATIIGSRAAIVANTKAKARIGKVSALRVVLVGGEAEIIAFMMRYNPWTVGIQIVGSAVLRGASTLQDDLTLAAATARVRRPDDIYILLPWSEPEAIDACIEAFTNVPASIHLGPPPVLDRFTKTYVSRIGKIASLRLVRSPLSLFEVLLKRIFDLLIASAMSIALLPLFAIIAIAIKLESRGPVLFWQRRYGFNQETFQIVKFRSMVPADEGFQVRQATRNDPRVTRVGRFLRRFNIDELPQLFNVLRGDMSLVGPRPHALSHNQKFQQTIAAYARRHNVKPGISGWAQIHGLRGEIGSTETLRLRLEHDLYYIDNWSVGLDLRILFMTLLSAKAFENAF